MTPNFSILLKYALLQLRETNGWLSDLVEDYIERSRQGHQEHLKDSKRMAGLRTFDRWTDSETKIQHICQLISVRRQRRMLQGETSKEIGVLRPSKRRGGKLIEMRRAQALRKMKATTRPLYHQKGPEL